MPAEDKVDAITSEQLRATVVAGRAIAKRSGCASVSGVEEDDAPEQRRGSRGRPIEAVASVSGRIVSTNGGGAATTISGVPCHRCHWIAPPEPKSVDDHIPIRPAPSAT